MLNLLLPTSPPPQQIAQFYPAPITTTTTTIVTPTTIIERTAPTVYFSPSYRSNYPSYPTDYRTYPQATVIIQTTPIYYPPAIPSRCSTSIVGSPIPSAVTLDRLTGQPCR